MTVVLLHAFPLDEHMWRAQRAALEEAGHEVVAPRLYGRGSSLVGWAEQLLGEIDGELIAVGASMGGYVALQLARLRPERVAGLVLCGSRAGSDSAERRAFRDQLLGILDAGRLPPGMETDVPPPELAEATRALRDRPDATDVVRAYAGPQLLCVGDRDELLSVDEARAQAALAPAGSFEVIEDAGHLVGVDQPWRLTEILLGFLERWTK
ncbi:MAG: alpha/beta hydrolase [Thermoleophilia bacterium]|nr:alpha/beta hydrolase [Thermoleophilia bacterium]